MASPRCPRCGFSFAWDGRTCDHCPTPSRARWLWENTTSGRELLNPPQPVPKRVLVSFAVSCVWRIRDCLRESVREVVEALDDGIPVRDTAALWAHRGPVAEPLLLGAGEQGEQAVRNLVSLAGRDNQDAAWRVAYNIGVDCQLLVAHTKVPPRSDENVPLPPHLEKHRATVIAEIAAWNRRPMRDKGNLYHNHNVTNPKRIVSEMFTAAHAADQQARMSTSSQESAAQCDMARDLLGYPETPVVFNLAWRTDTVVSLGRHIHDSRDFTVMPILADALQDAGCDEPEILEHCRAEKPHFRGCWVLDFVLAIPRV